MITSISDKKNYKWIEREVERYENECPLGPDNSEIL